MIDISSEIRSEQGLPVEHMSILKKNLEGLTQVRLDPSKFDLLLQKSILNTNFSSFTNWSTSDPKYPNFKHNNKQRIRGGKKHFHPNKVTQISKFRPNLLNSHFTNLEETTLQKGGELI